MTSPPNQSQLDLASQVKYGRNFRDLNPSEQGAVIHGLSGLKSPQSRTNADRTWWMRQLLDQLEEHAGKERAARGRAYYRNGKVLKKITVAPFAVTGRVRGSSRGSHQTALYLNKRIGSHWQALAEAIGSNPKFYLDFTEGRLSEGIFGITAPDGMPLIDLRRGLGGVCTCFDISACKHMVALGNALADILEKDLAAALTYFGVDSSAFYLRIQDLRARDGFNAAPIEQSSLYDDYGWPIPPADPKPLAVRSFWRYPAEPAPGHYHRETPRLNTASEMGKNRIAGVNGSMQILFTMLYESINRED